MSTQENAARLIGSSVDDLKCQLINGDPATGSYHYTEELIQAALKLAEERGAKTKASLLRRYLKKLTAQAPAL